MNSGPAASGADDRIFDLSANKQPKLKTHTTTHTNPGTAATGADRPSLEPPKPKITTTKHHCTNKHVTCPATRSAEDIASHQNENTPYEQLLDIPDRYREALVDPDTETTNNDSQLPPGYIILILYAGKDDGGSTSAAIHQEAPWLSQYVVEIDIDRDHERQDMLMDKPYKQLLQAAKQGRILAIIGGPNCRTFSVRLLYPQRDGSPGKPLRGRSMDEIWGLDHNTAIEQTKVDNDSILLLRMLHLANVANYHNRSKLLFLLEHPADPAAHSPHIMAHTCPTIWETTTILDFIKIHKLFDTVFAQCMAGNSVNKMTKLIHNIPLLRQLDNLTCNHKIHANTTRTQDLARWGWQLNILIAQGVSAHLKYLRNYDTTSTPTDRPHDCTTGDLPHQDEVIVQIGHKQRPLRDGGGKPSPGRFPPNKRAPPALQHLGAALSAYVITQNTEHESQMLHHGTITECPFTPEQIATARTIMNNATTHTSLMTQEPSPKDNPSLSNSWPALP